LRAGDALARAIAEPRDEGSELAVELVRWFRDACNVNIDDVVRIVNEWKPFSPTTPHLDNLYAILVGEHVTTDLVARLKERYPDPEKTLIALLDEVFPDPGAVRVGDGEIGGAHRTAFASLLLLGTNESIEYVLLRLPNFDWSDDSLDSTRAKAFQSCSEGIRAATLRLWPAMSWSQRVEILGFLCAHNLHNDQMLTLLTGVKFETLSHADLVEYIEGLWHFFDRRTTPQVRKILDRALHDAELGNADAKAIVEKMLESFGGKGPDPWLTDEHCQRIETVLVPKKRIGSIEIIRMRRQFWIARGPVPLAVAHELYEDVVGRRDVRVDNDLTRPPPTEKHVTWYTMDGVRVLPTKEARTVPVNLGAVIYHDRPAEIASGFVSLYAIESEAGLQLFEAVLRKHGIDRAPPPSWWQESDGNGA
jgi:hypothetical protein